MALFQKYAQNQIQSQLQDNLQNSFKDNLTQFARNEFLSDCVLLTEGKLKLPAHKIILASHSKLFYEFFKKYPAEKEISLPIPITMKSHQQFFNSQIIFNCISSFYYPFSLETLFSLGMNKSNCLLYLSEYTALNCTEFQNLLTEYILSTILENQQSGSFLDDFILLENQDLIKKCSEFIVINFEKLACKKEELKKLLDLPLNYFEQIIEQEDLSVSKEDIVLKIITNYISIREAFETQIEMEEKLKQLEKEEKDDTKKEKLEQQKEKKPTEQKKEEEKAQQPQEQKDDKKIEQEKKEEGEKKPEEKKDEKPEEKKEEGEKKPEEKKDEKPDEKKEEKPEDKKEEKKDEKAEEKKEEKPEEKKEDKPEDKKNKKLDEQKEKITTEQKKESPQLYDELNLNKIAVKKLTKFKLTVEQKKKLLLKCRLSFVSHEQLLVSSMDQIYNDFKDIFLQAISAKLSQFEQNLTDTKYLINLQPRNSYKEQKSPKKVNAEKTEKNEQQIQVTSEQITQQQQEEKVQKDKTPKTPIQDYKQEIKRDAFSPSPKKNMSSPMAPQKEQQLAFSQQLGQSKMAIQLQASQLKCSKVLDDQPLEFSYQFDGDENGSLYYLGTCDINQFQRLGLTKSYFSSIRAGQPEDFVGRSCTNCSTLNEKNSFMAVDLGEGRTLFPECYSITNRNLNTHIMLNWILEASIDNQQWYVIDRRIHFSEDEAYNATVKNECELLKVLDLLFTLKNYSQKSGAITTWGIDVNEIKDILAKMSQQIKQQIHGFRHFRIVQFNKNSHGSYNLNLSGIELYGKAYGEWIFGLK